MIPNGTPEGCSHSSWWLCLEISPFPLPNGARKFETQLNSTSASVFGVRASLPAVHWRQPSSCWLFEHLPTSATSCKLTRYATEIFRLGNLEVCNQHFPQPRPNIYVDRKHPTYRLNMRGERRHDASRLHATSGIKRGTLRDVNSRMHGIIGDISYLRENESLIVGKRETFNGAITSAEVSSIDCVTFRTIWPIFICCLTPTSL